MRTIVFEVPSGAFDGTRPLEALVTLWDREGQPATIAFRQPTPTSSGTWGVPWDAVTDEDEALREVAIRAADRMLRQRIEAITDRRLREELLKAL